MCLLGNCNIQQNKKKQTIIVLESENLLDIHKKITTIYTRSLHELFFNLQDSFLLELFRN